MQPTGTPALSRQGEPANPRKKYDFVRVKLYKDNVITTISLKRKLVEEATRVLGSERKVRDLASAAALEYIEGESPARTRSSHAARALLRLLNKPLAG